MFISFAFLYNFRKKFIISVYHHSFHIKNDTQREDLNIGHLLVKSRGNTRYLPLSLITVSVCHIHNVEHSMVIIA